MHWALNESGDCSTCEFITITLGAAAATAEIPGCCKFKLKFIGKLMTHSHHCAFQKSKDFNSIASLLTDIYFLLASAVINLHGARCVHVANFSFDNHYYYTWFDWHRKTLYDIVIIIVCSSYSASKMVSTWSVLGIANVHTSCNMQKFMQMKFALDLKDHKFHMRHVGLVLNASVAINAAKHQHPSMSTENASVSCNNYYSTLQRHW